MKKIITLTLFCLVTFLVKAQHVHSIKSCCKAPVGSDDCLKYCSQIKAFSEQIINDNGELSQLGLNTKIVNKINDYKTNNNENFVNIEEAKKLLNNAQTKELIATMEELYRQKIAIPALE